MYEMDLSNMCKDMGEISNIPIGYYRDGYHYSKLIYCDGKQCEQYNVDGVNDSCEGKSAGFINSGYNILFCKDETPIPFHNITVGSELFTKGGNGPFRNDTIYYALKKSDSESLIINKNKSKYLFFS